MLVTDLIIVFLNVMSILCFLAALKMVLSLFLSFSSVMMYLGVCLFGFVPLGFVELLGSADSCFSLNSGCFLPLFLQTPFLLLSQSSSCRTPSTSASIIEDVLKLLRLCSCFLNLCSFNSLNSIISVCSPNCSLCPSSTFSTLLLNFPF